MFDYSICRILSSFFDKDSNIFLLTLLGNLLQACCQIHIVKSLVKTLVNDEHSRSSLCSLFF
jgi:hypothetical protein